VWLIMTNYSGFELFQRIAVYRLLSMIFAIICLRSLW
jgi:hypothetical protein